ncbi:hypothetical protein SDC9_60865 [bioreactor metagenome]|uniref:Uncharacterized protein n=1 Tax=bioreactor metagenome TaxID=1076179 RepID=A0A644XFG5_9ZZZZ
MPDPLDAGVHAVGFLVGGRPYVDPERVVVRFRHQREMVSVIRVARRIRLERAVDQAVVDEHARNGDNRHQGNGEDGKIRFVDVRFFLRHVGKPAGNRKKSVLLVRQNCTQPES